MRQIVLLLSCLLFLVYFASAFSVDNTIIFNTTLSNSSITFSSDFNITNVTIEPKFIYLVNVSFVNATGLYVCGDINQSKENVNLDSLDFNCTFMGNITEVVINEAENFSGSSGSVVTTYYPTVKELEEGYIKNLARTFRVRFFIDNQNHFMTLENINKSGILVSVASEKQEKWLDIGEEWFVELSGNEVYDVYIKLNSLNGRYANITLKKISVPIGEEIITQEIPTVEKEENSSNLSNFLVMLGIVLVLVFFVLVVLFFKKPKWERRLIKNSFSVKHLRKGR